MSLPFDPNDPEIRHWLIELNVAIDDVRAAYEDKKRKRRNRDLGHRQFVAISEGAFDKIDHLLGRKRPPPTPATPAAVVH